MPPRLFGASYYQHKRRTIIYLDLNNRLFSLEPVIVKGGSPFLCFLDVETSRPVLFVPSRTIAEATVAAK